MSEKLKTLVEKCRKIKGFEIICAIVIAVIAICVYFSVNAMTTSKDNTATATTAQPQEGLVGDIKSILSSIDGVGECEVLITYKYSGDEVNVDTLNSTDNIQGVVVVAQGGQDVYTRIKITNALCTLLKIEAGNIQIFEMK